MRNTEQQRRAFTRIELVAVIAALSLLAAIFIPLYAALRNEFRGLSCFKQQLQIGTAWSMYQQDYDGHVAPLATAAPAPTGAVFPAARTWWPDLLVPYTRNYLLFYCPSRESWGIGMNHPEVGRWLADGPSIATFAHPDKLVVFADAGRVTSPRERNPDKWREDPSQPCLFFRTPNDVPFFNSDPQRVVARHNGRTAVVFADGHGRFLRPSEIGFQYPKGDPRALWDLKQIPKAAHKRIVKPQHPKSNSSHH